MDLSNFIKGDDGRYIYDTRKTDGFNVDEETQLYVEEHNIEIALSKAIKSYYEKSRNYTVNADIKTTPEQVEAAANKIKAIKDQIEETRERIEVFGRAMSFYKSKGNDKATKEARLARLNRKHHLIQLYNELGNLQQDYNSKYSIAAQLAQTATAATEIAEALTA